MLSSGIFDSFRSFGRFFFFFFFFLASKMISRLTCLSVSPGRGKKKQFLTASNTMFFFFFFFPVFSSPLFCPVFPKDSFKKKTPRRKKNALQVSLLSDDRLSSLGADGELIRGGKKKRYFFVSLCPFFFFPSKGGQGGESRRETGGGQISPEISYRGK